MIAGRGGPQGVRVEGYKAALAEAGADPNSSSTKISTRSAARARPRCCSPSRTRPTAIFAANDLMAIGAMQALRERGLAIPRRYRGGGFRRHPGGQAGDARRSPPWPSSNATWASRPQRC